MTPDEAKALIHKHLPAAKPGELIRYENVVKLLTWCKELKTDKQNENVYPNCKCKNICTSCFSR